MPIISRFFGIIIRMFFNEHAPPHFHVESVVSQRSSEESELIGLEIRV